MTSTVTYGDVRTVEVHFDDLDSFRTLYHPRYITLVDRAISQYWAAKGYLNHTEGSSPDSFQFIRSVEIEYERPIRDYGHVLVHFWVEKIGTTSLKYGFRLLSENGAHVHAHGSRVMVRFDPATQRPTSWTDQARGDLEQLLGPAWQSFGDRAGCVPEVAGRSFAGPVRARAAVNCTTTLMWRNTACCSLGPHIDPAAPLPD